MHLVMFDIDGTLTQTYEADERCFLRALREVFDFEQVDTDWAGYPHCTDSGILEELFRTRRDRSPSAAETAACQARFLSLLSDVSECQPFEEIPGAEAMLARLAGRSDFAVAVASGAWECSARRKLADAGLDISRFPAEFSDYAHSREGIMQSALRKASDRYARANFDSITYVGDGVWDGRASRALGFRFVGIAGDGKAGKLHAEGATHVFADYSDPERFISALQ